MKKTITEAQLRAIVAESVVRVLKESDMEEGFFKNLGRGFAGAARGVANGVGNAVDNMRMNAYQSQINGMNADNEAIDQQIQQLQAGKQQAMDAAAQAKGQEIDNQIAQLQAKKGNTQGLQDKWNAAGDRINGRQKTGYIGTRQAAPQDARNPQQGFTNY